MNKIFLIFTLCFYGATQLTVKAEEKRINSLIPLSVSENHTEPLNYKFAQLVRSPSSRSRREIRPTEFKVGDDVIRLNLTPVKHDAINRDMPVWTVKYDPYAPFYHVFEKVNDKYSHLDGVFYEDKEHQALLFAYYRDQQIYYDGVIGEGRNEKKIRSHLENWYTTDINSINDHVIIQSNEKTQTYDELGDKEYYTKAEKLAKPLDTLYPKLLLIVEFNLFKKFDEDISKTIEYLSILWNRIDMKYREIPSPQVQIEITGVIIAKDDLALDFILSSRNLTEQVSINHIKMMNKASEYLQKQFNQIIDFKNFDSAVVMTTLRSGAVAGSAYIAQICNKNAIYLRDDANFGYIECGVHELGHSLGLAHDAEEDINHPVYSTIMFGMSLWPEKFIWSKKSIKQLQGFATTKLAQCLEVRARY